MSLKDRLNTVNTQNTKTTPIVKKETEEPRYYESDMIAKQISLGVIDEILIDDEIDSIYVNGAKNIFVEKRGIIHKSQKSFRDNVQLLNLIKKTAKESGILIDEKNPVATFSYSAGTRITVTIPPISSSVSMIIKTYKDKFSNLQLMQEQGIISKETALTLEVISGLKNNIIIAGEKNSLKTTFLSALAKKAPEQNAKNIFVDYNSELTIEGDNYTSYNFSKVKQKDETLLLDAIISAKADRLIVNQDDETIIPYLINKIQEGYCGIITTLTAKSKLEALDKLTCILLKEKPYLTYEKAKEIIYSSFDFIIFTKNDKTGRRLESLSQINDNKVEDIFYLNQFREYVSGGIIPEFFEKTRSQSPINASIFDRSYKHTQNKTGFELKDEMRNPNPEFLKKFAKKEIQEANNDFSLDEFTISNNLKEEDDFENLSSGPELSEANKKAKEKLEELKARIQDNL